MGEKIKPTPCTDCKRNEECYVKCKRFENWFKVSWREVVKPFREIAEWKKEKERKTEKEKEKENGES